MAHGGKRKGAGRKARATERLYVPEQLVKRVRQMIEKHWEKEAKNNLKKRLAIKKR